MKATGIIRKIDELGRIVLAKELRMTMHIGEEDPIEIEYKNDMIILTKYDAILGQSGLVSRIDPTGRLVLPKDLRTLLDLKHFDPLEIFIDDNKILLKKFTSNKACVITGEINDSNFIYDDKLVFSKEGASILINKLQKYIEQ